MKTPVSYENCIAIKVGSYPFSIIFADKDDEKLGGNYDGRCLYNDRVIIIRDDLPYETTRNVIIHELVHAILMTQGRWSQSKFTDEEMCEFIAFTHDNLKKIMIKVDSCLQSQKEKLYEFDE